MQEKDFDLEPKPIPLYDAKRLAKEYIQLCEIKEDHLANNRRLKKSLEEGIHPLSHVEEEVDKCVKEDADTAWKAILFMIDLAKVEASLALVAAGPLEDFLSLYPEEFIERVENQAKKNQKFKNCLSMVWQNTIPEKIWNRILISLR